MRVEGSRRVFSVQFSVTTRHSRSPASSPQSPSPRPPTTYHPPFTMLLGIEIGGTETAVRHRAGDGPPNGRLPTARRAAGTGRRRHPRTKSPQLPKPDRAPTRCGPVGIGFGGPVDLASGSTIKSDQIDGWEDFPLVAWCQATLWAAGGAVERFRRGGPGPGHLRARPRRQGRPRQPAWSSTPTPAAAWAGAVIDGQVYRGSQGIAAEIGHMRPGQRRRGRNKWSRPRPAAGGSRPWPGPGR